MGIYYKRNLPHYQPAGYIYFVTFRLAGSLPPSAVKRLQGEKEIAFKTLAQLHDQKAKREYLTNFHSRYFLEYDRILDKGSTGPSFLKSPDIIRICRQEFLKYDRSSHLLNCFSVMPNHVHMVLTPLEHADNRENRGHASRYIITKILQGIKSRTAIKINHHLGRSGKVWQNESYDHVIRNDMELERITGYVLNNPVKADLCTQWKDWPGNYINL